jgi:hypothetical protein
VEYLESDPDKAAAGLFLTPSDVYRTMPAPR